MMNRTMPHTYPLIGLLLLVFATSCTKRSLDTRPEPVPIRLYTGIRTRAAVDAFDATPVCVAVGTTSGLYTASWDGIATAGEIALTPVRYYPEDGTPLFLRGYYPPAPMQADGSLSFTLTGEEDLLLSDEQSGSLSSPFTSGSSHVLMYNHLLTKLNFTIHLEGDEEMSFLRLRSLRLHGLAEQVQLNLSTGVLTYGDAAVPVVVYTASEDSEGIPFVSGELRLPDYVLVQPGSGFTLDMVLSIDDDRSHDLVYQDLAIDFEGGSGEGGIAYTVKVSLPTPTLPDPVPVKVTASVTSWQEGDSGSGDIPGWDEQIDSNAPRPLVN